MRIQHIVLPSIALAGTAALILPGIGVGYSVIGGSLGTSPSQRDVRVFNNFTNPGANDNQTADSNFPGYDGAEMAIWKSVVEWGSTLHGSGNGDPGQPGSLGSGMANFDAAWAGNATSAGGTNDNIMSLGGGCDSQTLAYTETPINNGWRIIFCNQWSWSDGPNTNVSGVDIQGVSAHEYGHALGLGHSNVGGATMFPSISGSGVAQRSIAADDIAGVQFIYGAAAGNKPRITNITLGLGSITITGQNFAANGNEVWFTSEVATAPGGDPMVKVLNVNSNGSSITVSPPANAGSGDVLVKVPGGAHSSLSNAWPADLDLAQCPTPYNFCIAAPNSYSPTGATMAFGGTTEISNNDFVLMTLGVPPNKTCLYIYAQNQINPVPFGNGFRCIANPIYRIYPITTSDSNGDVMYPLDIKLLPAQGQISAGQSWAFMCWYRDPSAGGGGIL